MGAAIDIFAMVRKLFPGREDLVERLFWSDVEFRSLCIDFRACHEALERLRCQDLSDRGCQRREYTELLEELAEEIRSWSDTHPSAGRSNHPASNRFERKDR